MTAKIPQARQGRDPGRRSRAERRPARACSTPSCARSSTMSPPRRTSVTAHARRLHPSRSGPSWPTGWRSTGIRRWRCATGASCCWHRAGRCRAGQQRWHGRGLPAWADELVGSELLRLGAVGIPVGSGTWLAAPTILAHGSDDLRERLLRPDPDRRADLVPAVQRARRRLGPGRPVHLRRPGRRQLGDQRAEGLEHQRAPRRPGHAAGPHRLRTCPSTRASPTSCCR